MNLRESLIAPHTELNMLFRQFMDADETLEEAAAEKNRNRQTLEAFGYSGANANSKPFAFAEGYAIIPVRGMLINRCSWSWGGWITGYNFIRAQLDAALADLDVETIVLDVDSYGGEAAGCFELCDHIYASRSVKPILAVVDSNCYSAGYAVASSASKIILTPSGGAGSIGVVVTHFNIGGMLKNAGVEVTFIKSGDHKTDGNPYEALSKEVKASIQANVDLSYDAFVALVARNRNLSDEVVRGTQAKIFRSAEALSLGLVDAVQPPSNALATFEGMDADDVDDDVTDVEPTDTPESDNTQEQDMSENANAAGTTTTAAANEQQLREAADAARTAERQRMSGIMGCDEAKGREQLANHIAMNTNMSVEDAKGMLSAAPLAQAASTPVLKPEAQGSAFNTAMSASAHPEVGADGERADAPNGGKEDLAAQMLADQAAVSGRAAKK